MQGQEKIFRVIEFILLLDVEEGFTKASLMEKLGISESTFKRYIDNLRTLGFEVRLDKKRYYRLDRACSYLQSIKNAALLSDEQKQLLESTRLTDYTEEQKKDIIEKLGHSLESDPIIYSFITYDQLELIKKLREAKFSEKQVVFKNYSSSHSATVKDRLLEPFEFCPNFKYMWCFDIDSKVTKRFKISRIEEVEILDQEWKYKRKHKSKPTDIFGLSSEKSLEVQFEMNLLAKNLLIEETSVSPSLIHKQENSTYHLTTTINDSKGFVRFYKGLDKEIRLLKPSSIEEVERFFY